MPITEKEKFKISVIIPIFNSEEWLGECLESACSQTLKNIEIICVNDGSTDRSESIVSEYAKQDERIVLISQENQGVSAARNKAMDAARGKYIFFLDSDDTIPPEALELLYSRMEERSLDLISYNTTSFSHDAELLETATQENIRYFKRELDESMECSGIDFLAYLEKDSRYVATVYTIMVLRNLVVDNNMRFIPNIIHEDEAFVFEAYIRAQKAGCINQSLYNRRRRHGSIMLNDIDFTNVYGTYKAAKYIEGVIANAKKENSHISQVMSHISRLQKSAINKYIICSDEEREKINELPIAERTELEHFLIYPATLEMSVRNLRDENQKLRELIKALGETKNESDTVMSRLKKAINQVKQGKKREAHE